MCRACLFSWWCNSAVQPDGREERVKRKGVVVRQGLKEAWIESASRYIRIGYRQFRWDESAKHDKVLYPSKAEAVNPVVVRNKRMNLPREVWCVFEHCFMQVACNRGFARNLDRTSEVSRGRSRRPSCSCGHDRRGYYGTPIWRSKNGANLRSRIKGPTVRTHRLTPPTRSSSRWLCQRRGAVPPRRTVCGGSSEENGVRRGRRGRSDRRGAKAATRGGAAAFHAIVENRHGSRTLGRRRPRPRRGAFLAVPSGEQVRLHRPVD